MTESQIGRVTALVRKVYGDDVVLHCFCEPHEAWSVFRGRNMVGLWEGGLDAFEALLLSRTEQLDLTEVRELLEELDISPEALRSPAAWRELLRQYVERQQGVWVEQLAREWDERERDYREHDQRARGNTFRENADTLRECAAELRERAKGGDR